MNEKQLQALFDVLEAIRKNTKTIMVFIIIMSVLMLLGSCSVLLSI